MKIQDLFEEKENTLSEDLVKTIIKECAPFINEVKDITEYRLHRGILSNSFKPPRAKRIYEDEVFKVKVRKHRLPLHTNSLVHKTIDTWMLNKLGSRFRSQAVFCVGAKYQAAQYGAIYVILPIGDFKFAWSKNVDDLYAELDNPRAQTDSNYIADFLETAEYQTKNLKLAIRSFSSHEIMIDCESYYAFSLPVFLNEFIPIYEKIKT
jgi:hypothetical protein